MARKIRVFVEDSRGDGVPGARVNLYSGEEKRTDSSGIAIFVVETSDVSVYVDGREAYDGQTSRVPDPIIFTKR